MARNTDKIKRGWSYDPSNTQLDAYVDGTEVVTFDSSNGLSVNVNGFDLAGQTMTSVNALGSTSMITWLAASNGASGANDESPAVAIAIKVGGTTCYIPAFASI